MNKIRVFLVEDHATVREGVKLLINLQPDLETVGEAGDGNAVFPMVQQLKPDVVVMDISLPGISGVKTTEKIKQFDSQIRVLALTRHTEEGYLQEISRAGANGYILKQSPASVLISGIRSVAAGGSFIDPAIADKVLRGYVGRATKKNTDRQSDLSLRETEVLRLIAWGYSNKEIAARLNLSVKTVDVHKANSLRKLGLKSRIDIVQFAVLEGWFQEEM